MTVYKKLPRLSEMTKLMYSNIKKASDNATMKRAREVLLSLAPGGLTISVSFCFNYTENFRQNSRQHLSGRGVKVAGK